MKFANHRLGWRSALRPISRELWSCAGLGCLLLLVFNPVMFAQAPDVSPVVCSEVIKTNQTESQTFIGSVEPIRRSVVGAAVDGRVLNVHFEVGDPVGGEAIADSLVELRTETLDIEIATAKLQVALRQQQLDELRASLPLDIQTAQANLAAAEAQLSYAQNNFQRLRNMSGNGAVSQTEFEEARSAFTTASETVKGAQSTLDKLTSTKAVRILQAENMFSTAEQEIKRLNDLKEKYSIAAPFAGFVTNRSAEVGTWVTRGEPLFEVVQMDPIELVVKVPQKYIPSIQKSLAMTDMLKANLTFDSVEQSVEGEVLRVVPQADLQTRNFPVRIRIDNPKVGESYLLSPGMLGRATLEVGEPIELMMVNKDALVLGGRSPKVFKVVTRGDESSVVAVDVTTGATVDNLIAVQGDLKVGDQVVVEGNERLRPGQKVKVKQGS